MTHLGHIAPYMHFTLEAPNQHRILHKLGVEIVTYHMPTKLEEGRVLAAHVYDEEEHEHEFATDAVVVLVTQRRSTRRSTAELKDSVGIDALTAEGITGFYRIGDCEARGSPPTRSSRVTDSRVRSTPTTRRCHCPSSGSGVVEREAVLA